MATLSTCHSRQGLRQLVLLDPTSAKVDQVFDTYILHSDIRTVFASSLKACKCEPVHERLPWSSVYYWNELQMWVEGSNLGIVIVFFLTVIVKLYDHLAEALLG